MTFEATACVRILVVVGVANPALSFLLGWVLSAFRMARPIDSLRWLLTAHTVALAEGTMLLGRAFAMGGARLPGS